MNSLLVSCAGMAEDDDHTRLSSGLCALINGLCTRGRRVQAHVKPGVAVRLAREAAGRGTEERVVNGNAGWGPSSSSASERSSQRKGAGCGTRVKKKRNYRMER